MDFHRKVEAWDRILSVDGFNMTLDVVESVLGAAGTCGGLGDDGFHTFAISIAL